MQTLLYPIWGSLSLIAKYYLIIYEENPSCLQGLDLTLQNIKDTIKTARASAVKFTDDRKQEPFYVTLTYLDKEE